MKKTVNVDCVLSDGTKVNLNVTMNADAIDDMDFFEKLIALDNKQYQVLPEITKRLFTDAQKRRIYDAIRQEDGRVPVSLFVELLPKIMAADEVTKKS